MAPAADRGAPATRRPVCSISLATSAVQPVWWLAPEPGAGVAVEVLVEQDVVAPVRVVLEQRPSPPKTGRRPPVVAQEEADRGGARGRRRPRPACSCCARAGRALDREVVAVVVVELLERLDEQVVDREPDRSAPVRVAAEEAGPRLGRLVVALGCSCPPSVERDTGGRGGSGYSERTPWSDRNSVRVEHPARAARFMRWPWTSASSRRSPVARLLPARDEAGQVRAVAQEPAHPAAEVGQRSSTARARASRRRAAGSARPASAP